MGLVPGNPHDFGVGKRGPEKELTDCLMSQIMEASIGPTGML
jgi:hypothetical protein